MFSLRIVNVDHYMSSPKFGFDVTYSQFRGTQIKSVPVFRIFGSTPSGNKTCLHVHGVFPYILVPYSGEDEAGKLMYQLASSLDKAINVSQNTSLSSRQHVFKIVQVSGRPFYGYHSQDHQFLKIFFYNPLVVKRACDLLQNGAVCGTKFQIHEGHVPFTLQFFIDYNLYGMSFINLKNVVFRKDACPPGVSSGELPKESFCELEADAVAVDIMNRLTIEGELAVNPGLAAIWREEKERLRRDALDVSQRPEAPLALSERLLMDKLCDNIKYQGKCKTPLKENIPYPAETQRTTGSEILDASILDTHSMTSLASKRFSGKAVEAATVIDEELVLSLTQSSVLSSSLDQSLLAALDDLAAHSEAVSAVVSQQVEEDSILGSQMVQELDMFGSDASDGEQEALNFSLPPDLFTDDQPDDENSEDTDENFEESIPQVDGVGEFGGKKRKSKQRVKKRGVLMENSASESYPPSDGEEMLLNNIKDNNCWPETGKQETLEEIFSDEEPFNSPINNFDERCGSVELEPINVDLVHTFEMVLRGDPSLTSGDLASEDVMFQPAEDVNDEEKIAGEEAVLRNTQSDDKRPGVDKNSNINTVVSLNTALDSTEDKSVVLDISSDELLNTSQLDEMFNEDLNKGLEIICEKSPQQEFEDKWSKPEENSQVEALDEDTLNYEMIETSNEVLVSGITKGSESGIVGDIITNGFDLGEDNFEAMPDLNPEDLNEKSFENCTYLGLEENCSQISATSYLGEDEIPNDILGSCKETLTPVIQNVSPITRGSSISKSNLKSQTPLKKSPQKGIKMKISVNLFNQKKTEPLLNNLSEMTRKEIETYYLQLETLSKFLSQRTDMEEAQPMLWFPIRKGQTIQNLGQKRKRKRKPKTSSNEVIMKKCKFSDEEILKMKSCKVMVHKLNYCKVNSLVEKQVNQSNTLDVKKTSHLTNVELSYSDAKSLQNPCKDSVIPSLSKRNFEKASKMSKESIKEERVSESLTICTKTPPKLNKSPRKLPDKIHKKSKHNNVDLKKTFESEEVSLQVLDKLPSVQLTKVENTVTSNIKLTVCEIQDVSNNNLKNKKISSKIHSDKTIQNKPKVKKHRSLSNKNSVKSKREENNDVVCDNVKKFKSKLKDKFKEITNMNIESQTNKDTAPLKDQSTSFKKNKECVIKLLPLVVNEQEKSGLAGAMGSINSEEALNNTHVPNSNAVQESVLPKPVGEEPIIYPLVKAEKLIAPSHLVKDIPETKTEAKSKKQRSIENECRTIKTIYSLDGTVDSSSSDENVEDRSKRKPDEAEQLRTPKKRKKSKSTHSPRSYVPLSIEIKKSPKLLSKNKNPDLVGNVEKLPDERNENTAKDNLKTVSNLVKPDITNCNEKRKLMEPVVALERLQLVTNSDSDNSDSSSKGQPVPSSSHPLVKRLKVFVKRLSSDTSESPLERERVAESVSRTHRSSSLPPTVEDRSVTSLEAGTSHPADRSQQVPSSTSLPQIKRLKVFVKRLSLDTKGCSLEHGRVAELKGRSHRRLSLPTSVEEKTSCSKTVNLKSEKQSQGELVVSGHSEYVGVVGKEKRVRKVLTFSEEGRSLTPVVDHKRKPLPERKLSIDMFDGNSTPESLRATSSCGEGSSDSLRLSGISKFNSSDCEADTIISAPTLHDVSLSPCLSECGLGNKSMMEINRNPHDLRNPSSFTPALVPPSRAEVLAKLGEFGLPEVVNEVPFYSDPGDVSKACEVGSTVLKLKSKSVVHMEEFEGTFGSISKLKNELYKKMCNLESKSCFVRPEPNKTLILTPLKPPPTLLQAKEWLKSKLSKKNKETVETKTIAKVVFLSSPGNAVAPDDDDDGDDSRGDSLTLSQCTPLSNSSVEENDISTVPSQTTPEGTAIKSSYTSPLMASTPVNIQLKKSASKRFSRPSSKFRQSLPLIKEENQDYQEERVNPQDEIISQPACASDSTKLSDSGIKRLLSESKSPASTSGQIDMVTPNNSGNYRLELENLQDVKLIQEHQCLTILSMELHVHTRGDLRPNPDHDEICCIFYNITNDCPDPSTSSLTGAIYVSNDGKLEKMPQFQCELQAVDSESSLIAAFVDLIRKWDPDIFVGYEIELLSWGYLLQRGYVLNMNLVAELSRMRRLSEGRGEGEAREVGDDDSEIRLTGRIVLNLWRFLRHEVALQSYTFENIMYHVLHQRVPLFSFRTLTSWWAHRTKLYRWLVFEHYFTRVEGIARVMRHVDLVGRTSEFARLFGIQFYEVLSRGSQFRVESMMLRLVKPLNYVAVSPSVQQRARMRAPESLPLIMEPQSRFYTDPVIVLDFQSLYPSIIIAYNYCFSTCLGRVEHLGRSELFEFGCTQLRVPVKELVKLKDSLNFSPCGVAFVKQSVVRGVLPRMLEEILNTRLMVKQSMKENKENKTLQRVLHNRQLGLKLIANVTYGYTAANFSGRMPCIEVGDSVVSKARETLERAISLVGNNKQWGARVVYGDTDSMFVLVPGKSRQEAFRIGAEIAEAVTNDNPQPVKLKLEKVYQPCLLQTKKRYVGYMYESPNQEEPVYDAKGIETVRRDGCPAVAKILEKSLRLLFETKDMSLVKRYVCRQFTKVVSGRVSVQDLTFAREYRGAAGYRPGACVPALELARQGRTVDPRSEPRVGERVPYVVVAGAPGLPLIRLVRPPSALLQDPGLRVNAEYYITRVIAPPLDRCFSLLGAQVAAWYSELPRKQQLHLPNMEGPRVGGRKATISQYFATCGCIACGRVTSRGVCDQCVLRPQQLSVTLATQILHWERRVALVTKICHSCCGRMFETDCTSLDCPVLYRLCQARKDLRQADYVRSLQDQFINF